MINEKGELVITWCVGDVMCQAKNLGILCSEKKAHWVLGQMDHHHDGNLGITWDTIAFWLQEKMK
jgi:hypothetical protein